MNKILKLLAAATLIALTTAACQKEKLFDSQTAGEETVTFTVKTDAAATKATADNDGLGADLTRCLVAVYMKTGDPAQPYKLYDTPATTGSGLNYTFTVNLIRKQTYQIVVWADKGETVYDVNEGLTLVTRKTGDVACNSDAYDAFYASTEFVQGTTTSTAITAKRPFAQLNLITKDLNENFQPGAVSVTYSSPQSFNPFDGTVSADMTEVTYKADSPYYTLTTGTTATQHTLVMNYLFAAAEDQTILPSVKMTAKLTVDAEIEVANVPVRRNYRTNIIGNLLTEQTDFNITVDSDWGDSDIDVEWVSVATVTDANLALQAGKTNVAIESVETDGSVIEIPQTNASIGISLPSNNAKAVTIKYKTESTSGQTPNLNVAAENNTGDLVINAPQSHVTLNGAAYNNVTASTSNTTLVVEEGVTIENLTVNQGAVEIYGTVKNITLAQGCTIKVWAVGDKDTFNTALAKGAETIQLKNDICAWDTVCLISRDLAVDGKGYTITGSATRLFRITTAETVVKFNDINLVNTSTSEDARCISFDNTSSESSLYVENCSLTDPEGKAIFATPASNLLIDIKDSEISAWAAINITANNSTIKVTNSVLKGRNPKQVVSPAVTYGTIVFDGNNNLGGYASNNCLNIYNSTIYAIEPNENIQAWLALQNGAQNNIIKLDEATRCLNGNDESINTRIIIDNSYDVKSVIWIGGAFVYPGYEASIGSKYYVTLAEALAAVQAGETVQILKSGEYSLETLTGANYTLEAVAEGVVLKHTPVSGSWIAKCTGTVTVKNLTWDVGVPNYQYFQNVDAENCTIKGCPFAHTKVNFKSCNFVVESNEQYNIWTYAADIVFDDCTFNCAGKSVLVYKETGTNPYKVTLNKCVFNASQSVTGNAAIEIDSSLNPYEVYINNCSQTGFANGSVSNNPLWNNKKGDSSNLKVFVDGVQQTL